MVKYQTYTYTHQEQDKVWHQMPQLNSPCGPVCGARRRTRGGPRGGAAGGVCGRAACGIRHNASEVRGMEWNGMEWDGMILVRGIVC